MTERSGLGLVQAFKADEGIASRRIKAMNAAPKRSAEDGAAIITRTLSRSEAPAAAMTTGELSRKHLEPEGLWEGLVLRIEKGGAYRLTDPALENRIFVSRLMKALRDLDNYWSD